MFRIFILTSCLQFSTTTLATHLQQLPTEISKTIFGFLRLQENSGLQQVNQDLNKTVHDLFADSKYRDMHPKLWLKLKSGFKPSGWAKLRSHIHYIYDAMEIEGFDYEFNLLHQLSMQFHESVEKACQEQKPSTLAQNQPTLVDEIAERFLNIMLFNQVRAQVAQLTAAPVEDAHALSGFTETWDIESPSVTQIVFRNSVPEHHLVSFDERMNSFLLRHPAYTITTHTTLKHDYFVNTIYFRNIPTAILPDVSLDSLGREHIIDGPSFMFGLRMTHLDFEDCELTSKIKDLWSRIREQQKAEHNNDFDEKVRVLTKDVHRLLLIQALNFRMSPQYQHIKTELIIRLAEFSENTLSDLYHSFPNSFKKPKQCFTLEDLQEDRPIDRTQSLLYNAMVKENLEQVLSRFL